MARSSCSSSSRTRSTPARLRPSSVVISWMRRRRSTSACEYSRVPLGERLGSIRPRASYMRSVCGCISASSAATEIMNTPRSLLDGDARGGAAPDAHGREQPRARVAVHDLRQLLDRLGLLVAEAGRDVDDEAVVDVARGPCRRASAGPRRAGAGRCRAWSRRGRAASCARCSVGTSTSAPRIASGIVSGTSTSTLSPLRLKTGLSAHARDDVEVAGRAAVAPGLALAGEPHARALAHAGGDVHAVLLDRAHRARALAGRARVLDDRPGAAAARARLGDREQALALGLDAAALAARADLRATCRAWRRCRGRWRSAARSAR